MLSTVPSAGAVGRVSVFGRGGTGGGGDRDAVSGGGGDLKVALIGLLDFLL